MSSAFRITQRSLTHSSLAGLQANLARLQQTQARLSSGRAIQRPSDSPTGTMAALRLRADVDRYTQLDRNAEDGKARLGTADNALTDGLSVLRQARDAVLRELREESGLEMTEEPELVGCYFGRMYGHDFLQISFRAPVAGEVHISPEHNGARWVDPVDMRAFMSDETLLSIARGNEAIAAVIPGTAQHGNALLVRKPADDLFRDRASGILHQGLTANPRLYGEAIGAAHLLGGQKFEHNGPDKVAPFVAQAAARSMVTTGLIIAYFLCKQPSFRAATSRALPLRRALLGQRLDNGGKVHAHRIGIGCALAAHSMIESGRKRAA